MAAIVSVSPPRFAAARHAAHGSPGWRGRDRERRGHGLLRGDARADERRDLVERGASVSAHAIRRGDVGARDVVGA